MKRNRPELRMLTDEMAERIVAEARDVLGKTGVLVENEEALDLLREAGCRVESRQVYFPGEVIDRTVKTVPASITVYDRNGKPAMRLEKDHVHFDPGSAALRILDPETGKEREPVTADLVRFARLTDGLGNFAAQSTGLISTDVPKMMQDRYRLFIALTNGVKPVVTGTFAVESFEIMKRMLVMVRGSEQALREKPLAIFDCCPSPPLKWSRLTCQNLIDCARAGIPAELVSMPLTGATAPVTLAGALVQLTAENLSGIVIHQLAGAGSPIIFGGSPAAFDMRKGTTPMGAVETMMIDAAYARIGKWFGFPTHAYMGLSDAKAVDAQAGLESGMGALLAALAGINVVSGPGMLDFESCQSLEKLVLDNEICGMALRMVRGVEARGEVLGKDLYGDVYHNEHFIGSEETLRWVREEMYYPGTAIDRDPYEPWLNRGGLDAGKRAGLEVERILAEHRVEPLPDEVSGEMRAFMKKDLESAGAQLPEGD